MLKWLDGLPMLYVALPAILLAISPIGAQPHLLEKLGMLASGTLSKPIDILDLLMHSVPLLLLAIKLVRMVMSRQQ